MVYHKRVLHNYLITCHRKYISQHNRCDIRATHDGKVASNTVEYTTAFLYSDWMYFLWQKYIVMRKFAVAQTFLYYLENYRKKPTVASFQLTVRDLKFCSSLYFADSLYT